MEPPGCPRSGHRLHGLFAPRSVAVVGASERNPFSAGAMHGLQHIGFSGPVHLVNRRGTMAFGRATTRDCRAIGAPVDAAYLCVPQEALLESVHDAIAAGIANLVILTSGLAEVGGEGARLEAEIKALCASAGVRALGPNCLGFRNMLDKVALGAIPFVPQDGPGSIALVSVSGSVANHLAGYGVQHGLGFTHLIATGNEMNVTAADCVDYLVDLDGVKAIALFLEGVSNADVLAAAAERARAAHKPIVVIKAGAAPATAAMAAAHTSAVVGDDRVFDAACDRLGIVRVSTLEDLILTAGTMAATGPLRRPGVAFVSMSGGMCEIASDYGAEVGVSFPPFAPETVSELGKVLSNFGQTLNPLDLTGAAVRDETLWTSVPAIVSRDPAIGMTIVNWAVPKVPPPPQTALTADLIGETHKGAATPVLLVSNVERSLSDFGREYLNQHSIGFSPPSLARGLLASAKLAWWSERLQRRSVPPYPAQALAARPCGERETLAHLAHYGLAVIPTRLAHSAAEARRAAAEIGGNVVLKLHSPDIAHKSEVGGVALNLRGDMAVEQAYDAMMRSVARHAPQARLDGVIVAPMRTDGLELLVGVARDPQWGLVMALGMGGVWVEVLDDTALRLLPADVSDLAGALRSLKAARLFEGYRGGPAADIDAIAEAAACIGRAAAALGPDIAALEVNPLYVRGDQVEALDALATWAD